MTTILMLLFCVFLFTTGDYFATRWGQEREHSDLLLTLAVGPFGYLLFGYLAANTSLAKMGGYVNCGIVLCSALAGVIFFDERLNRTSWLGIFVIIVGIALLSLGKVSKA